MWLFGDRKTGDVPAVSVLTPIYNVEKYLPKCLESLKAQTLKNIEFICINDGSTDHSLEILQQYAEGDPRFKIIDKKNSGYGSSMNQGLDAARGEYIGILESDDFASPDMFKKLYRYASRHDLDIVKSNYFEFDGEKDTFLEVFSPFPYRKVFDPRDVLDMVKVLPIIWAALYRREMLVSNNIRFSETPGASFQDTSFVFRSWVASHRVALLRNAYLHYRVNRNESSVKSSSKVFEVCGEYEVSEAFLREDPQRVRDFGKLLNVMKLDTYRWNYNRIAEESHLPFAERWASEFRSATQEGLMDPDYFSPSDWELAQELMADPASFVKAHSIL
ncbi:glycosyltransferase family 2 protein [Enorma phocaeensis]|uniref:Glycosyltransferase family 2 protein n=1 Tax=Enorma phocaeensis TaxID=1871019 RepID=A0ABT7V874_9ACTN|nr:glycosyltransferase family 2 protein [Enorma phocaeensis]MDM8274124.1 glycosyltransferase family 2 protein [Enorma phocaeensis]